QGEERNFDPGQALGRDRPRERVEQPERRGEGEEAERLARRSAGGRAAEEPPEAESEENRNHREGGQGEGAEGAGATAGRGRGSRVQGDGRPVGQGHRAAAARWEETGGGPGEGEGGGEGLARLPGGERHPEAGAVRLPGPLGPA